ncbi:ATP-binding cassette domain-containing protein [Gammaproteobacteria bacterium]|nr:ATP-binding cassette domain-containing protein [Gammaproteobacteria bacterium]
MSELEVRQLNKTFGHLHAVKDVSFKIPEGAIFGLIGRNGAGKTTTIRMMMDIIGPDSGEILVDGKAVGNDFRRRISYLPEERGLYKKMKVMDVLNFFMEIKGIKPAAVKNQALDYLDRFQLLDRQDAKIEDLSKGNQQKIQFISAILSDPEFIILDEPFSGLDPVNTDILKEIIIDLKQQGKMIIFSTHLMDFADKMCDQIALIHQGELILNGPLQDIKKQYSGRNISLVYEGDISFLESNPMVESVNDYGNATGIALYNDEDIQNVLQLLIERQVVIKKFDANEISLQEIFLKVAGSDD